MTITHNEIDYTFSVREHAGKFSQSKKKHVGQYKDLDCAYSGGFASVTVGLKPGSLGDVQETGADAVRRLIDRIPELELRAGEIKAVAALLS